MPHALFYAGPFEDNFPAQQPGTAGFRKRDGSNVSTFRIPANSTGLRFAQMQKKGRKDVITRILAPGVDICLSKPIPGQGTGPQGTRLTSEGASAFLTAAIRANPRLSAELRSLNSFL